jgi:hypothetical protein
MAMTSFQADLLAKHRDLTAARGSEMDYDVGESTRDLLAVVGAEEMEAKVWAMATRVDEEGMDGLGGGLRIDPPLPSFLLQIGSFPIQTPLPFELCSISTLLPWLRAMFQVWATCHRLYASLFLPGLPRPCTIGWALLTSVHHAAASPNPLVVNCCCYLKEEYYRYPMFLAHVNTTIYVDIELSICLFLS